jgi:hypothetical protein
MDASPMNIQCERLDDLLLDGEPLAMATAERHAVTCPRCAAILAEWREISSTARELKADWPDDLLLPRIQKAIAAERKRNSPMRWWQVAAVLALTAILGSSFWLTSGGRTPAESSLIRVSALDQVEQAERAHRAAIDNLAREATPRLEKSGAPLMISYREKLMLLDDAIAQCQTAIDQNRQNAHLRSQLLAIYDEKQRTLQDVLREENHVSNQ